MKPIKKRHLIEVVEIPTFWIFIEQTTPNLVCKEPSVLRYAGGSNPAVLSRFFLNGIEELDASEKEKELTL